LSGGGVHVYRIWPTAYMSSIVCKVPTKEISKLVFLSDVQDYR